MSRILFVLFFSSYSQTWANIEQSQPIFREYLVQRDGHLYFVTGPNSSFFVTDNVNYSSGKLVLKFNGDLYRFIRGSSKDQPSLSFLSSNVRQVAYPYVVRKTSPNQSSLYFYNKGNLVLLYNNVVSICGKYVLRKLPSGELSTYTITKRRLVFYSKNPITCNYSLGD